MGYCPSWGAGLSEGHVEMQVEGCQGADVYVKKWVSKFGVPISLSCWYY